MAVKELSKVSSEVLDLALVGAALVRGGTLARWEESTAAKAAFSKHSAQAWRDFAGTLNKYKQLIESECKAKLHRNAAGAFDMPGDVDTDKLACPADVFVLSKRQTFSKPENKSGRSSLNLNKTLKQHIALLNYARGVRAAVLNKYGEFVAVQKPTVAKSTGKPRTRAAKKPLDLAQVLAAMAADPGLREQLKGVVLAG